MLAATTTAQGDAFRVASATKAAAADSHRPARGDAGGEDGIVERRRQQADDGGADAEQRAAGGGAPNANLPQKGRAPRTSSTEGQIDQRAARSPRQRG